MCDFLFQDILKQRTSKVFFGSCKIRTHRRMSTVPSRLQTLLQSFIHPAFIFDLLFQDILTVAEITHEVMAVHL